MTDINRLIWGKHPQDRIVSLEVKDDQVELFVQNPDGTITSKFENQKFWILASKPLDKNFIRMKGDLHYKWGRQFTTREAWSKVKFMYNKEDIYAVYDPKEATMLNKGLTYYKGLKPKDVSILSFDIETTGFSGAADKLLLISNTFRDSAGVLTRRLFSYDEYESEGQMLEDWCLFVREQNPSIICGHNIYGFDLPFLQAVADREQTTLALGRDGSDLHFAHKDSQKRKDGSQSISYKKVRCYGRELIDTMFLAITYDSGRKYESYGLKKIIEQEGIRFEGRVLYDAGLIKDNYLIESEWTKIKSYCIYDSDEALQLFDLMCPSLFYLANSVPKSFQSIIESATGAQINSVLVRSYLQEAHSVPKATELTQKIEGGISFGIPGIYRNSFKLDIKSAYPSQVLRFKLFDPIKDPYGNFYEMVNYFTLQRFEYKKMYKETGDKYYMDLDASAKVFINSAYGVTNTNGLNFNSPELAAKITAETRAIIGQAIKWASGKELHFWWRKDEEDDDERSEET
jgi:DNA polymerase elongation subunit (family B)